MKKRIGIGVLIACAAAAAVFFIYVSDYYRADDSAGVPASGGEVRDYGAYIEMPAPGDTGLIFYPGGKVQAEAYMPLLDQIRARGVTCVLVRMPFHLAVFGVNAADGVYGKFPAIKNWYIGGHSLGGAMAGSYASGHADRVKGLVLLGAYVYGGWDPEKALTVYGENDRVLDRSRITYTQNVLVIQGGNHAQFGNYGEQQGDGEASISRAEQQSRAAEAIAAFMQAG